MILAAVIILTALAFVYVMRVLARVSKGERTS